MLNAQLEATPKDWTSELKWYYVDGGTETLITTIGVLPNSYQAGREGLGKRVIVKLKFKKGRLESQRVESSPTVNAIFNSVNSPPKVTIAGTFRVGEDAYISKPDSSQGMEDGHEVVC